jgi:PAS domain S-box-containing protein
MINQVFTIYSVFYLVTTLVSFFIAFLSWQRKSVKGAKELTSLMIASGIGAFCLIFETAAPTIPEKIIWAKLEYIGGVSTPVLYLIFVLRFTGRDKFLSLNHILLLFIIPFITLMLTITNEYHNLMWSGFSKISESTNLMEYYHGIWFWIGYIAYTYILLFWAAILLFYFISHQTKAFRSQGIVVFIAGLCPWIASLMYLIGNEPVPGLDLPPISLVLSGTLAAYAILNIRFLDLIPVARETLVETLSDGILVLDGQNRIQDINEAALSFLGIPNKNIIGSSAVSSGASFPPLLDAAIDMKSSDQIEISGNHETKTFTVIKKMIKNQPGSRLVVIRDITERKRSEEELIEKKERYRGLSEASFEAIFISENGICIEQNQAAEKMFGYTSEEAIGRHGTQWIAAEDRDLIIKNMLAGFEEPYEATALKKDGTTFPCLIHGKMMHYKGKNVRVTSLNDITVRKRAEKELIKAKEKAEESDRLKSAFLANMSHEIRTPMNSILGFTDLLKTQDLKREEQKEYIQIIQKGGDRLLNIINDIIDISKIESGQMEVTISKTNINEQIEYISSLFRPEVAGKRIQLITKNPLPGKEAIISTDREKIFAILTNLVKNAIKFTNEGSIELGYEKRERHLEFFVKDTGTGIPYKLQEIIFERFRQGNDSLNRNYEGTGLGLSISKAYVELLGGKIKVESEPGKGSVFYFTIPYNSEAESNTIHTKVVSAHSEVQQIKCLKILIAEDDEASAILLTEAVKIFCKGSLRARTGREAVETCRSNSDIDLVLMDIKMPEMDGYEAARQIRQFNKNVIIIAQTAFALTGDKEKALEAGCNDYISKPVNSRLLKVLIQKYFKK